MSESETVRALRSALDVSPDNVPLRLHLGETLLKEGQAEDAGAEFKRAMGLAPNDAGPKLGFARACLAQGNNRVAAVVLESVLERADPPAEAYALHARMLVNTGEIDAAVRSLKQAVELDPGFMDHDLAKRLGIGAEPKHSDVVDGKLRAFEAGDDEDASADSATGLVEKPGVTFEDVGGMDGVKEEVRLKIIHPLTHKDIYAAYGKQIGGGILMYGPPGCGKTHLARATAGEVNADFISVGLNDVLDMWIGQSEHKLHAIFEQARRNKPCVLFFDEVDALGASRTDMRRSGGRHLINQFLSELDGMQADNDGLLILAATNAPWHLDAAFRRPGRFDRIIFVPPPDDEARREILRIQLEGKPVNDMALDKVAAKTDEFSGADLKALVDVAIEGKLAQAMKTGKPEALCTKDLLSAAKRVKPTTREWFVTARNYALYANEGGLYDDILDHLGIR